MPSLQTKPELVVVFVTCPADRALEISRAIIDAKVAACVNATAPVTSTYYWKNAVCVDEERLLIIKTTPDKVASLETKIKEIHPYTVPEFVVIPSSYVSESYLNWAKETVTR